MTRGLYVSPTEFVSFAQQNEPLAGHLAGSLAGQMATRSAAGDLSGFFGLLPNPDPVLKSMGKDIAVYRNLLAHPMVISARRRRVSAVLSMESGLSEEASSGVPRRVVAAAERWLATLDMGSLMRQLMDGAFFGYRVGELMWAQRDGHLMPTMIAKPSEWFGFDPIDARLKFKPMGSIRGQDVPDRKFIVVGKMRNWENPYGEPELAPCFWPVTFMRGGLKFWVTFTEKYGMPWAVGKLPRTAQPKEVNDLADQLSKMVRDAVAVVPDDSSVELLSMSTAANADMFKELLMYCRSEISVALLGNNQSTEAASNLASATAAQKVESALRDDDAAMIAEGINQMVRWFVEVNFPGSPAPVYEFWEQEEVDELLAKRDEMLKRAGAVLTNAYFKRAYKLEEGDLAEAAPEADPKPEPDVQPKKATGNADAEDVSFADGGGGGDGDDRPADQVALDAAIDKLPAGKIQAAMKTLLQPALDAIARADTPEAVQAALLEAWPEMDASALEQLMAQAYFVSDLVGRDSVASEAETETEGGA